MKKVLIVDDAQFMRLSLKTMLEKNGFHVAGEAENGILGIAKYIECAPDIVTMDITMPEMSGVEALKAIRKHDPKACVVMVSAMGQESLIKEAIINGAKYFIVKPFKEDQIVETLKKICQTKE
ncbi:MAG TPA: response regulator [Patescibacteria group bacterium]|nr:response regulator [Patescibacteria group bacterium]